MTKRLVLVALAVLAAAGFAIVACNGGEPPIIARFVPAKYRDVRTSAGHKAHLGKLECGDCHDDTFAKPPADLCTRCHAKTTPLHPPDPTASEHAPTCTDCHSFTKETPAWSCMSCHDRDRGHAKAVGTHSDEDCSKCHQPHATPATTARTCTSCHNAGETQHAGLHGCLDCHSVHENKRTTLASIDPKRVPPRGCESCHAKQPGKLHVDDRALTTGHVDCTSCHKPHKFDPRPCADCHKDTQMIASPKHTCIGCHDQHVGADARACSTCHREQVKHPKTDKGECVGCHRPHEPRATCESCHGANKSHHATAKCLDCHVPHEGKPQPSAAFCSKCHADNARTAAGHSQCITCHANAAHAPSKNVPACATCHADKARDAGKHAACANCHKDIHAPAAPKPACATCHAAEATSAPQGHAQCASCHQPHAPNKTPACATCHVNEGKSKHGQQNCETCHRPHGPGGVAKPAACTTCHPADKRFGLHRVTQHADCKTCHSPHEARPRDDRATCLACHPKQQNHEPTAPRCATCHPFR